MSYRADDIPVMVAGDAQPGQEPGTAADTAAAPAAVAESLPDPRAKNSHQGDDTLAAVADDTARDAAAAAAVAGGLSAAVHTLPAAPGTSPSPFHQHSDCDDSSAPVVHTPRSDTDELARPAPVANSHYSTAVGALPAMSMRPA